MDAFPILLFLKGFSIFPMSKFFEFLSFISEMSKLIFGLLFESQWLLSKESN